MATTRFRYATFVVLGILMAALTLVQAGCPGVGTDNAADPASGSGSGQSGQASDGDGPKDPLLRSFSDALDAADDLESEDLKQASGILNEADPLIRRVKQENREALRRANTPPKIRRPRLEELPEPEPEAESK